MAIQFHKDGSMKKKTRYGRLKEYIKRFGISGIGKNAYVNGNYKEAMVYFKTNDRNTIQKHSAANCR